MKVVLINSPTADRHLKPLADWFGIPFTFEVVKLTLPYVPMQKHPTSQGLAVLDMEFVQAHKKGMTVFIAPFQIDPRDRNGVRISSYSDPRASVQGIMLPPLLSFQRWEWFWTRLFWDAPAIEVFAGDEENNHVRVGDKDLGPAILVWLKHEFCHWLKLIVVLQEDTTHKWFYWPNGTPDKVRDEIKLTLKPMPNVIETPNDQPPKLSLAERLARRAESLIGKDASPKNLAPQELSCAEGMSAIINAEEPSFKADVISTIQLDNALDASSLFIDSTIPKRGTVIISPRIGDVPGHVGIFLSADRIASNDSETGVFKQNYTLASWSATFGKRGRGLKIYFYEPCV